MYAIANPKYTAASIAPFISESDKDIDVLESQLFSNRFYGDAANWGVLEEANVNEFLGWLQEQELETTTFGYEDLVFEGLL